MNKAMNKAMIKAMIKAMNALSGCVCRLMLVLARVCLRMGLLACAGVLACGSTRVREYVWAYTWAHRGPLVYGRA